MKRLELIENIRRKQSFLCVGLDPDLKKMPAFLIKKHSDCPADAIIEFNKAIIDATASYAVAFKPNTAFYEQLGVDGWRALAQTVKYIKENYPGVFVIADAKRGDIGNTSRMYAKAFFEDLAADAVTVAPYMGHDSVSPFLEYEGKWTVLLALTSNSGAQDFELIPDKNGHAVFERVLKRSAKWGNPTNLMFVVGATQADMFDKVRAVVPRSFLLVPGVGAQGGDLEQVCKHGLIDECGLLVNSSRAIIYASDAEDYAQKAADAAKALRDQMSCIMKQSNILQ